MKYYLNERPSLRHNKVSDIHILSKFLNFTLSFLTEYFLNLS
jgi:hypothetical protein